jgi:hypothetical protein
VEVYDDLQDVTIHAHGKITGKHQYNNEPANFTVELHDVGIKPGHNPRADFMSDRDYEAYESCLNDLKGKKGINKYAVCMASIKKGKRVREKVSERL